MEISILGSGTSDPSEDRGCASYLLKLSGRTFLVDAGPGSYRQLMKMGVPLTSIDHFFITHFHIDHVNDLPAILFSMKYSLPPEGRKSFTIHGPNGFREKWNTLMQIFGKWINTKEYTITIAEHWEDEFNVDSIKITTLPMEHGEPCIGFRFDDGKGKTIAYSGDTASCNNIIKLAMNCDALLMECTRPDDSPVDGHSSTSQVGAVAQKAEVKTLLLTHISPDNDTTDLDQQVSNYFDGIVIAVRDGMRITI